MSEQVELVSKQQLALLKQLSAFESPVEFHSLNEIPLPSNSIQLGKSNSQIREITSKKQAEQISKKSLQDEQRKSTKNNASSAYQIKRTSSILIPQPQNPQTKKPTHSFDQVLMIQQQLQKQQASKYNQLKSRLLQYKQKSDQIYKVTQFIKSYQQNFTLLVSQKQQLLQMLNSIKGQTSQLVEKQKKLIDLSMEIKQSLDYYTYHQKHQFNFACEISSRQLFETTLQPTLSTIMDAIEFFEENSTFVQSKKHLGIYTNMKSKMVSFIKSFYIKLFNKENNFVMKCLQSNQLYSSMNGFYVKSRVGFLTDYISTFPQLKRCLKDTLASVKDLTDDKKINEVKTLEMRQIQIDEFILSESNLSLIRYLQSNNFDIYSQVMLNLFTFNRFNFHENLLFAWTRKLSSQNFEATNTQTKATQKLTLYKNKLIFVIQLIVSEYIYINLCCHPTLPESVEFMNSWLYKLVVKYLEVLVKEAREFVIKQKFNPFELCEKVAITVETQLQTFFDNMAKQQYQSYALGTLWQQVIKGPNSSNSHRKFLTEVFKNSLQTKLLAELGQFCFQSLPKLPLSQNKEEIQENINKLVYFIPKLKYCSINAENYLISSLDTLIKSIKQFNLSIQSRFQCYAWNLVVFGIIRQILDEKQFQVVSKEIRLDFNQSLNIIDRVKRLERSQSLIKYAQDIFNVIKTGMPSLNELTLDFNKYVHEHYQELESRFLRDILFIYAKNMIEFLQKMMDTKKKVESQKQIPSQKHLQQQNHEQKYDENHNNHNQSTQHQLKPQQTQQSPKTQKSPKTFKRNSKTDDISKLCQPITIRSLYNSYILSIERYIKESRQILRMVEDSKIRRKEEQVKNLRNLIKEVYEKLFDFLDTFYVTVSEVNEEVTAQFEEIAKIKQSQEQLWLKPQQTSEQKLTFSN